MRVKIRKTVNGRTRAVIITFNTRIKRFDSNYDRNKFFRELHGWEQVVPGSGHKKYRYHRPGVLNEIPHAKIADSVFMIMEQHMKRMQDFFQQWEKKVNWEMHEVVMKRQNFMDMVENHADEHEEKKKKMRRVDIE